jgi:hypothetical protein
VSVDAPRVIGDRVRATCDWRVDPRLDERERSAFFASQ